ncbi:MAG: DUF4279 domain-containing protein [Bacteroidetes bacterium]|nr:DUF4279 domain-containing protein [Bacteroidota bacterium]
MKNEVVLNFIIADFEGITHDEITKTLDVNPTWVHVKGQKRSPKFTIISKNNVWSMDSGLGKYASFKDQMNALLDILESKKDLFKSFCEKYYCEFSCTIYIYYDNDESTPWIHLDERYNKLASELRIEFDIDLYCLPNKES